MSITVAVTAATTPIPTTVTSNLFQLQLSIEPLQDEIALQIIGILVAL